MGHGLYKASYGIRMAHDPWGFCHSVSSMTHGKKVAETCDIYSLAMVVVEAFTGEIPFPECVDAQVMLTISKGRRPPKPPGRERLGLLPAIWKLTKECWNQNPDRRPDVASVLRRFQVIVNTGLYQSTSSSRTDTHCRYQPGQEKPPSPIAGRIKRIGLLFSSAAHRQAGSGRLPNGAFVAQI